MTCHSPAPPPPTCHHCTHPAGVQVGGGGGSGPGGGASSGSGPVGGASSDSGWDWNWEGAKARAGSLWEDWKQAPHQWAEAARQTGEGWRQRFSWQAVEEWQERHWRAFEERQRARLAALNEEQRQLWEEWSQEGGKLLRREVGAFEEWQRRYWEQHHPEAEAQHKPTCTSCRLSYLMLPLLPNFRESLSHFGKRTKVPPAGCLPVSWPGQAGQGAAGWLCGPGSLVGTLARGGRPGMVSRILWCSAGAQCLVTRSCLPACQPEPVCQG